MREEILTIQEITTLLEVANRSAYAISATKDCATVSLAGKERVGT